MPTTRSSQAKSKTNGSAAPTAEDFDNQVDQLRADIASLTETVQQMASGKLHETQSRANETANDVLAGYEHTLSSLRGEVDRLESDLTGRVRANPLQSLGLAVGAGFLLALFTRK